MSIMSDKKPNIIFQSVPGSLHTCSQAYNCIGCSMENQNRKERQYAKYVWMVHSSNPCDIRRYEFTHAGAVSQLAHNKGKYGDWVLYKLVRVNRRRAK